jgi:hypothetical protein
MSNKITINETVNTVRVNETTNTVTVQEASASVVKVVTEGPQGIQGPPISGFDFDGSAKVSKSVVYYDSTAGKFKADNTWTTSTLVFGGDF